MWTDNKTNKDFLNFSGTAKTVADMVIKAADQPVSIGITGGWGVGKSSMLQLIEDELKSKSDSDFVFVDFNAWLYQGFDDAKAALLDVIASVLEKEAEKRKKGVDKVKDFLKRVDWIRATKLTAETAGALALGIPPPGLITGLTDLFTKIKSGDKVSQDEFDASKDSVGQLLKLYSPENKKSPPKEIQTLRDSFEKALEEIGITLVVFVDDLDRCLPKTTISTLEAMRLFLFLNRTAFIIAADDTMIRHAVKTHFVGLDENLVTNYFDKLIQIPIRVPQLGTQEVRAYLFLLYVANSSLEPAIKSKVREQVINQLTLGWQGKRVDKVFMTSLDYDFPSDLISRFDMADRIAHIMTTSDKIKGNPRLIKRFLNALSIRMSISSVQGIGVDEAVLTKMLLFERCGPEKAYQDLRTKVSENDEGRPDFMKSWEDHGIKGNFSSLPEDWEDDFIKKWLVLPPLLSDKDLRGALYVSREHAPLVSEGDKLTGEAVELLNILIESPKAAPEIHTKLIKIAFPELSILLDKVIEAAKQVRSWGTPPILDACIVLAKINDQLAKRVQAFLSNVPPKQITAGLIPRISDQPWSHELFTNWSQKSEISKPVKNAIQTHGNIAK